MNIAIIFAGGFGQRMHSKDRPKQFLMVHGKPIIVHTIEIFQRHSDIDGIVVACIEDWIPYMEELKERFCLSKIGSIVPGGKTGQMSIYNALCSAKELYGEDDNIVLVHDGVRPLIDEEVITNNIKGVKEHNSAITCGPANETFIIVDDEGKLADVPNRNNSRIAKAPESFWLKELLDVHHRALEDGIDNSIDSCTLMSLYGHDLYMVNGSVENIKITTPNDFYTFRAIADARENEQLN